VQTASFTTTAASVTSNTTATVTASLNGSSKNCNLTLAAPAAPNSGLVAAYSFDEGTGLTVTDTSGNGLTGTIVNASWSSTGKYGKGIAFNGTTSYVDLGNPTPLQFTGSKTVEAWINAAADPADDGQIIAKSDGYGWQFKTSPDTGPHTFGLGVSPNSGSLIQRYSTSVRSLNTWYHVAGVYDAVSGSLNIYVNGVLNSGVLTGTIPLSQFNQNVNVNIGRRTGGFYFSGIIDEVRIYNRALSAAEIQTDMNTPIGAATPPPDTTPPAVSISAPANGTTVSGTVTLTAAASDAVGVAGVQFFVNNSPVGSEDTTSPYSVSWNSANVADGGPYTITARARDAAGNQSTSAGIQVSVSNTAPQPSPSPSGLVAQYRFDEGSGTVAVDSSGNGNHGTISNGAWRSAGRYGSALWFNGSTSRVNIPDAPSLDLTTGMTFEAWIRPSSLSSYRTVVMKEQPGGLVYALFANTDSNRPSANIYVGQETDTRGPRKLKLNSWSHLAATYDGKVLRLYVNGTQVSSRALAGSVATSAGALRIGGNAVWGEYFSGMIDEVRIYNRALTGSEIQADMNSASTSTTTTTSALTSMFADSPSIESVAEEINALRGTPGGAASRVRSLSCAPQTVSSGGFTTCTLSITSDSGHSVDPSGEVDSMVPLASDNALLRVPETISIAPGKAAARFIVLAGAVDRAEQVTITAGTDATAVSSQLIVLPASSQTTSHPVIQPGHSSPILESVVNAASNSADNACSPGGLASMLGWNLREGLIRINDNYVVPQSVSPTRITFLCPEFEAGTLLTVSLITDGGESERVQSVVQSAAPGIFTVPLPFAKRQGLILAAHTGSAATMSNADIAGVPVERGSQVSILATSLGRIQEQSLTVFIGGTVAELRSVSLTEGSPGIYRLNVKVPDAVLGGAEVPVYLRVQTPDGRSIDSEPVTMAIQD
jgi:uncharacterized protein (TIGR03437 family)